MTLDEAVGVAHTLSKPSKMPWLSYSIPASRCKIGALLARKAGTVCSICYAKKGRYVFPNVQTAMEKRYRGLSHPAWVDAMATLINSRLPRRASRRFFR